MEISSQDIGIYVDMGTVPGTPDWKLIGCSTTDSFNGSTDPIAISNKCVSGFVKNLPGNKSWGFGGSAYAHTSPDADQASHVTMFKLWNSTSAKALKRFKIASEDGTYIRIGEGFVSAYNETAAAGDYLQFDYTITGNGAVSDEEE